MTREIRDLMARLAEAEEAARAAIQTGDDKAAEEAMTKVRSLRARIKALQELEEGALDLGGQRVDEPETPKDLGSEYKRVFVKAIRNRGLTASELAVVREYRAAMHEGGVTSDPDGDSSLIVPQDIQTRINEIMRSRVALSQYVRVERVNTLSGSRVLERDEDMTPLAAVDEYGEIPELDNPKFTPVNYQLRKRAGILPITNELLNDTDQNLLDYVADWIARKVLVTHNTLILDVLRGLTPETLASADDLKKVLNMSLDPDVSLNAVILTNQDGYHWLDTLKDNDGRYLLQPDVTQPGRRVLFGRPVVPVPNRYLPSTVDGDTVTAPFFIGALNQFEVLFTRGVYELASTREGGQAWRRDTTELRVISRDDCRQWDAAAAVYGLVTVSG